MGSEGLLLPATANSLENGQLIMASKMPYNDIVVNECFYHFSFLLMK